MAYDLINAITGVATAIGTVGATIVALWLGYRDSKPKLQVYATVGITLPDKKENLMIFCTNISKQPIVCTGFAFNPHKLQNKALRLMPDPRIRLPFSETKLPSVVGYSMRITEYYSDAFFNGEIFKKMLSKYEWLARRAMIESCV